MDVRKCLVWDLDQTVWHGTVLEGSVHVRPETQEVLAKLDARGILHAIASRGDEQAALEVLRAHGLHTYFVAAKINWLPKPTNIIAIAEELGLGLGAFAFIDDEPFERAQVGAMLPAVLLLDAAELRHVPDRPEFSPAGATREGQGRRRLYQAEAVRERASRSFATRADFLASCDMRLVVRPMRDADVPRVAELMTRTHQLNTTGVALSKDQLADCLTGRASAPAVWVADLEDRFGPYGTIAVALVGEREDVCWLEFLALSCRVMGRGIERAFLAALMEEGKAQGFERLEAGFRDTGRNQAMRALYIMAGLNETTDPARSGARLYARALDHVDPGPPWVEVSCASS